MSHCHVKPEPTESAEPQPERRRDLVFDNAAILGFEAMRQETATGGPTSLAAFRVGLRLALDYVLIHDRRLR